MIRTDYDSICKRLDTLIDGTRPVSAFSNAASFIYHELTDVSWVGFYFFDPASDKLILGPFQGKPACVEIGRGKGVCGKTLETGNTIVVSNVLLFPGHIACDADSRSEIVVPINVNGKTVCLLDIDSTSEGRFTESDKSGLEAVVSVLEKYSEKNYPFKF